MKRTRKRTTEQLFAELKDLTQQANDNQPGALQKLRDLLEQQPEMREHIPTLGKCVERAYLSLLAGSGQLTREMILQEQQEVRKEFLGEHPTAMERMLVDLICVNRLALYQALQMASESGSSMTVCLQRSRRVEIEQRRFLQSVRTLATLRELLPRGLAPLDGIKLYKPARKKSA